MSGDQGVPARQSELTFTGPATFFKAPLVARTDQGETLYDAAFLGVPFDFAVGFRPGARFAPAAVRQATGRYALPPEGYYDFAGDRRRLVGVRLADAGDVDPNQLEHADTRSRITAAARALRRLARLPLFVGGDHSISYPLLEAFDDVEGLCLVQLDAHLDFSDARNGTRFSNSSPFRRAAEALPNLGRVTTIGLRGMRADAEAFGAARARGHALVSAQQVHADLEGVLAELPVGADVYLSIDVDVLDPAELPGTSSPEPDGLGFSQVLALIRATASRNRLVGVDLTELSPPLDPSGRSELLAARLLAETLAAWWESPSASLSAVSPGPERPS